jgi:ankyrin repeat protein
MAGRLAEARAALRQGPSILASLRPEDHALLALAIFHRRFAAAKVMVQLGFDPMARGMDGGTALHAAAWVGNPDIVRALLIRKVGVNDRDPTHGSPPLGWAAHGSVHGGGMPADYIRVIRLLVRAGADIDAPGNNSGVSMSEMAAGCPDVQSVLRELASG